MGKLWRKEPPPHPRYPLCDMLVPWAALSGRHPNTIQCTNEVERKWRRLAEEEVRTSTERAFQAYGLPLNLVSSFKYLGRILTALKDKRTAVMGSLCKLRKKWARLSRILGREGANVRVPVTFFKVVVQVVLLFGL